LPTEVIATLRPVGDFLARSRGEIGNIGCGSLL